MNYIDYIIIILLVIAAVKGATKGFIYEVASLIALIGGVWGAIKFSHATETFLEKRLDFTSNYINIIAFVITFIIIIVLVHLLAKAIEKELESVSLGTANRILGLIFASLKMAFILGIIVILIEKIDEHLPFVPEKDVQTSKLYDPLRIMTVNAFPFLEGFYQNLKSDSKEREKSQEPDKINTEEKDSIA